MPVAGDGNCFFYCIAKHVYGTTELGFGIRQLIVNWLQKNGDFIAVCALTYLPSSLTYLPSTLTRLTLSRHFNQLIDNLPASLTYLETKVCMHLLTHLNSQVGSPLRAVEEEPAKGITWEKYLKGMRENKTYATFPCIVAAAELFGAEIRVISDLEGDKLEDYVAVYTPQTTKKVN
jgi:hypothetical protein